MHVFFISKHRWLDATPMGVVATNNSHSIARTGATCTFLTQGDPDSDWEHILTETFGLPLLPNYRIRLFRKSKALSGVLFHLKIIATVLKTRTRSEPTVVITRNTHLLPTILLLKILKRSRAVFETHGYNPIRPEPNGPRIRLGSRHFQNGLEEWLLVRFMDLLVCLNGPMAFRYHRDYPSVPVINLPLGSPSTNESWRITPSREVFSRKHLVHVGTLRMEVAPLFEALKQHEEIRLTWVGVNRSAQERIQSVAKEVGVHKRVFVEGWVSHPRMREILRETGSAGLVGYWDTYDSQVKISPTKLFDYFSLGLPVVAAATDPVKEIVAESSASELFEIGSVESCSRALGKMFDSYETWQTRCDASLQLARKYSWDNRGELLVERLTQITA